jgi:hypothetical protein
MPNAGASQHRQLPPDRRMPVDPRLEYWPVIHCELCGAIAIAAAPSTQFCIDCGLYVCAGCWREAAWRCTTCALSGKRPSMRLHVWTLRRADRRLREVLADLDKLDDDTEHGWDSRAPAVIKIEASLHAAELAADRLPRSRQQPRVAALLRRIERDAATAWTALERPRGQRHAPRLAPDIPSRRSIARVPPFLGFPRGRPQRGMLIAAGASAAVLTVLVGWSVLGPTLQERGIAEGVLSGGPQDGAVHSPDSAADGGGRAAVTPSPAPDSVAVFDFDGRQMGSGLGADWRDAGGGEVSLAAFPTGVDRSARLVADGSTPAKTCRRFEVDVRGIEIDVFLDPLVPVAARVELTDAAEVTVIAIELSESRSVVSTAADVVEGAGVTPARWIHVAIRSEDGGVDWEVTEKGGRSEPAVQGRSDGRATDELTQVCLGVDAIAGGTAHYDNVAIRWTGSEGG